MLNADHASACIEVRLPNSSFPPWDMEAEIAVRRSAGSSTSVARLHNVTPDRVAAGVGLLLVAQRHRNHRDQRLVR